MSVQAKVTDNKSTYSFREQSLPSGPALAFVGLWIKRGVLNRICAFYRQFHLHFMWQVKMNLHLIVYSNVPFSTQTFPFSGIHIVKLKKKSHLVVCLT